MKELYVTPKMIIVTMDDADIITSSMECGTGGNGITQNFEGGGN